MLQEIRSTRGITWRSNLETVVFERLRDIAASKLCTYHEHVAASGSVYITIDDWPTLRFADHETTSPRHRSPDFDFVRRAPTEDEFNEIADLVDYPNWCKKTPFARHVGLTVPKMKSLLTPDCYKTLVEDGYYFGTFRKIEVVVVATALETLRQAGITKRIPVPQESFSMASAPWY